MSILVFGSLNIDHVYQVDHFVRPGETLASTEYRQFQGGKGANQSIALARAGAPVFHAGQVGPEGIWLREQLAAEGVQVEHVIVGDVSTGHAIIQVDRAGENAIVLYGGANLAITAADARRVLTQFGPGDWLLLQNEISAIPDILRAAADQGLSLAFNPAPMTPDVYDYPLDDVSLFVVNQIEGAALTGVEDPQAIVNALNRRFPQAMLLLTLGRDGSLYANAEERIITPAESVDVVDTTAAGDTFIGYFLAGIVAGQSAKEALAQASKAAAICITRPGAAISIPTRAELVKF